MGTALRLPATDPRPQRRTCVSGRAGAEAAPGQAADRPGLPPRQGDPVASRRFAGAGREIVRFEIRRRGPSRHANVPGLVQVARDGGAAPPPVAGATADGAEEFRDRPGGAADQPGRRSLGLRPVSRVRGTSVYRIGQHGDAQRHLFRAASQRQQHRRAAHHADHAAAGTPRPGPADGRSHVRG